MLLFIDYCEIKLLIYSIAYFSSWFNKNGKRHFNSSIITQKIPISILYLFYIIGIIEK